MFVRSRHVGIAVLAAALTAAGTGRAQPNRGPQVAAPTRAPREIVGEVMVILASEADGPVDPALAGIPALRQAPFSAFHSMQLLSRPSIALALESPTDVPLPNGRTLRVAYIAANPDGRLRVRVSIRRDAEAEYLPLLEVLARPGDPFFLAGQSFMGGTLVIGMSVRAVP